MITAFYLIFLHALGDYPFQGEFLAKTKGSNWISMTAHCLIWTGLIVIGLDLSGLLLSWHIPFLFFGHMAIDKWKCSRSGNGKELTTDLLIDQLLHVGQIAYCFITGIGANVQ